MIKNVIVSQLFFVGWLLLGSSFSINPFVFSVLTDPVDNTVGSSLTVEIEGLSGFVLSEEFKSGEALNIYARNLVLSGVDFDKEDVGVVE